MRSYKKRLVAYRELLSAELLQKQKQLKELNEAVAALDRGHPAKANDWLDKYIPEEVSELDPY